MHFSNVAICMSIVVCYNCFLNERHITSKKWKCLGQNQYLCTWRGLWICVSTPIVLCISRMRLHCYATIACVNRCFDCVERQSETQCFPTLCCVVSKWRNCVQCSYRFVKMGKFAQMKFVRHLRQYGWSCSSCISCENIQIIWKESV